MEHSKPSLRFIHFFGPDGAGKTTQVKILTKHMRQHGIQAHTYWVRSPHTLAFLLWKLLVKIGFTREVVNPFGPPGKLPAVDRNELLRRFWSAVELLGVLPLIARADFSLRRGQVLVAERYLLDTITTVAYFLNDINFLKSWVSSLLIHFIPPGTVFIFLDAEYATIFQRRAPLFAKPGLRELRRGYGATPNCPVEPRSFIEFQRKSYRILAKLFDPLIINTSMHSVEETTNLILRYLESYQ